MPDGVHDSHLIVYNSTSDIVNLFIIINYYFVGIIRTNDNFVIYEFCTTPRSNLTFLYQNRARYGPNLLFFLWYILWRGPSFVFQLYFADSAQNHYLSGVSTRLCVMILMNSIKVLRAIIKITESRHSIFFFLHAEKKNTQLFCSEIIA